MARTRPTLPAQASATAVAAVAKVAPLHPDYPSGFDSPSSMPVQAKVPALPILPDVTAHYPLS